MISCDLCHESEELDSDFLNKKTRWHNWNFHDPYSVTHIHYHMISTDSIWPFSLMTLNVSRSNKWPFVALTFEHQTVPELRTNSGCWIWVIPSPRKSFWLEIQMNQSESFLSQGLLDLFLGCILPHLQKLMVLRDFRLFKNNSERFKAAREKIHKKKTDVTPEKNENSNFQNYLPIILGLSTTIFGFSIFGSSLAGFSIFGSAFWGGGTVFGTAYFADSLFGNAYFGRSLFGSRNGFWK